MSYTRKILAEFTSRIDVNKEYTRNELGKILTKIYHEIKKPKRKTPFDFFIQENREKIKEKYPNLFEEDILKLLKSMWNTKQEEEEMRKEQEKKRRKEKEKEKAAKLNRAVFIDPVIKDKIKKMITLASHPRTQDTEAMHSNRIAVKLMQKHNLKIQDILNRRDKEILDNYKKRWG